MRATPTLLKMSLIVSGFAGLLVASTTMASSSGYNDWNCRPSADHPYPVVGIHALAGTAPDNFTLIGPYLASAGYCFFAQTYGQPIPLIPIGGLEPIPTEAQEVASFINQVLSVTSASKVDLLGYSEGAFLSLYIPKVLRRGRQSSGCACPTHPRHQL
jgi:triacylglycerol esterase/lipase EstA (alpha/beta hydrolase family)